DATAGLGRAGSRRLVDGGTGRARRAPGRPARALGPDARARRARRGRARPPAGDPLERPAHGRRVRRDRGARRTRAADRADRKPRPHRVHSAEAPLAPPPRATGVHLHHPDLPAEGLRPPPVDRRARVRRGRRDRDARVHVFCHAVPGTWHAMGVMLSAAGSLGWFRRTFAPGAKHGELDAEAATVAPGAEGVLFQPYLSGERTPHADPDARGAFVGLQLGHGRGHLARAVLEGVAYGLRDSIELLRALGVEPSVGRVSGGGARSRIWLRI